MIDFLKFIVTAPASADIAGLIVIVGMLCWILVLQIRSKQEVGLVSTNHLSGLPDMEDNIKKLVTLMEAQQALLQVMNDNIIYVRARTNGWNGR